MHYFELAQAGNGADMGSVWLDHVPRAGDTIAAFGLAFEIVAVVHRDATPGCNRHGALTLLLVNTSVNDAYGRYLAARDGS